TRRRPDAATSCAAGFTRQTAHLRRDRQLSRLPFGARHPGPDVCDRACGWLVGIDPHPRCANSLLRQNYSAPRTGPCRPVGATLSRRHHPQRPPLPRWTLRTVVGYQWSVVSGQGRVLTDVLRGNEFLLYSNDTDLLRASKNRNEASNVISCNF